MTLRQHRPTNRMRARSNTYPAMIYDKVVAPNDTRVFAYLKSGALYWIQPVSGAWRWLGDRQTMLSRAGEATPYSGLEATA